MSDLIRLGAPRPSAYRFTSGNSGILVPHVPALAGQSDVTLITRVMFLSFPGSGTRYLVAKRDPGGGAEVQILIRVNTTPGFQFLHTGSVNQNFITNTDTPVINRWYWLAAASAFGVGTSIYWGTDQRPFTEFGYSTSTVGSSKDADTVTVWRIGNRPADTANAIDGDMSFTRLYDRRLGLEELRDIQFGGMGSQNGLYVDYDIGADGDAAVLDRSGRGLHGAPSLIRLVEGPSLRRSRRGIFPGAYLPAVASTFAADITGSVSLSPALSTAIPLGAGMAASASMSAALTTAIPLGASLTSSGALGANLTTAIPLGASLTSSGALGASLTSAIPLGASPVGAVTIAADLTASTTLGAGAVGSVAVVASLTTAIPLASAFGSAATVSANLTAVAPELAASMVLSGAFAPGALTTAIPLAAAAGGSSTFGASLTTSIPLATAMAGSAGVTAGLVGATIFSATPSATITLSPSLTTRIVMSAAMGGSVSVNPTAFTTTIVLAAAMAAAAAMVARLTAVEGAPLEATEESEFAVLLEDLSTMMMQAEDHSTAAIHLQTF